MKPDETIIDFITGQAVPNIGPEMNRQEVERFLVEKKGWDKEDIAIDLRFSVVIGNETYQSKSDIVVAVEKRKFMVIRCAAGSLGSRERETLSLARLIDDTPIPYAVVSDGRTAVLLDTVSGRKLAEGMDAIPSKTDGIHQVRSLVIPPIPAEKKEREKLIFRSYDSMRVNVAP